MKVLIADFVYKLLAMVGLRSFALQFLVSFILIGLLLVGAMACVLAALATDDPGAQAMLLWLAHPAAGRGAISPVRAQPRWSFRPPGRSWGAKISIQ